MYYDKPTASPSSAPDRLTEIGQQLEEIATNVAECAENADVNWIVRSALRGESKRLRAIATELGKGKQ